jgi:hypothetical protein
MEESLDRLEAGTLESLNNLETLGVMALPHDGAW